MRGSLLEATGISGPARGAEDPFSRGEADVGFVCVPLLFWLREREEPPVELVGAAPAFRDARGQGRSVYFSEVVVRRDSPARTFAGLRGGSWAYNDPCSLSGYYSLPRKLTETGEGEGFFRRVRRSGSHLDSMGMVARGDADAAAIDSNVLRIALDATPRLRRRLRVIESWGPFPIQPVIVRSNLPLELKERLRAALLTMDANTSPVLAGFGLRGFSPVTHEDYAAEERALRDCEHLLGARAG